VGKWRRRKEGERGEEGEKRVSGKVGRTGLGRGED
jgi:hypothetical protein